jgi:hypothetical protein
LMRDVEEPCFEYKTQPHGRDTRRWQLIQSFTCGSLMRDVEEPCFEYKTQPHGLGIRRWVMLRKTQAPSRS